MNSFSNKLNMNQNLATPGFVKNSLYTNNSSNNKIFNFNNKFYYIKLMLFNKIII